MKPLHPLILCLLLPLFSGCQSTPPASSPATAASAQSGMGGTGKMAAGSGMGGTGKHLARTRGMGGTGHASCPEWLAQSSDRGFGGTGHGDCGLGGTGIIGVVTAFGSIWVNGAEIPWDHHQPVSSNLGSSVAPVQQGNQVIVELSADGLNPQQVQRYYPLAGRIEAVQTDHLIIDGQTVRLDEHTRGLRQLSVGEYIAVNGWPIKPGTWQATRIDANPSQVHFQETGRLPFQNTPKLLLQGTITQGQLMPWRLPVPETLQQASEGKLVLAQLQRDARMLHWEQVIPLPHWDLADWRTFRPQIQLRSDHGMTSQPEQHSDPETHAPAAEMPSSPDHTDRMEYPGSDELHNIRERQQQIHETQEKIHEVHGMRDTMQQVRDSQEQAHEMQSARDTLQQVRDTQEQVHDMQSNRDMMRDMRDSQEQAHDLQNARETLQQARDAQEQAHDMQSARDTMQQVRDTQEQVHDLQNARDTMQQARDTQEQAHDIQAIRDTMQQAHEVQEQTHEMQSARDTMQQVRDTQEQAHDMQNARETIQDMRDTQEQAHDMQNNRDMMQDMRDTRDMRNDWSSRHR